MNPMELFYILWFFVLPILGIVVPILATIFWFFIVPRVAKMLTWARFRNVSIHAVGDDSGYVELVTTKEELPEGIVRTKKGWHFLPRPIYHNPSDKSELADAERIGLKKYMLKGLGKPFFLDYAGKITSMNYGTLAAMQQTENEFEIDSYFTEMQKVVDDLPKHFKKELHSKLKALKEATKAKAVTLIDIDKIKQAVPKMYPPSLIDALATNREMKGMKRRGKEMIPLILGGAIIIGLVAITIVAIFVLGG